MDTHYNTNHHTQVHHNHPTVVTTAVPIGSREGPRPAGTAAGAYITCAIFLAVSGFIFLIVGIIFSTIFGFSTTMGVVGLILEPVGILMLVLFGILCRRGRIEQRRALVTVQRSGATTIVYGQQPVSSLAAVPLQSSGNYGHPGAPPIGRPMPQGSPIVYGRSGVVGYYPSQAAIPSAPLAHHPTDPSAMADLPPSYDDVVNKEPTTDE